MGNVRDPMEATMTDPRDLSYATEDEMLAKEVAAEVRVHHGPDSGPDEASPDRTAPSGAGDQVGTATPIEADPRDVDGTTADVERAAAAAASERAERSGERERDAVVEGTHGDPLGDDGDDDPRNNDSPPGHNATRQ